MDFNCAAEQLACEFGLNNGSLYRHQTAVNVVRNNLALYFYGFWEQESQEWESASALQSALPLCRGTSGGASLHDFHWPSRPLTSRL